MLLRIVPGMRPFGSSSGFRPTDVLQWHVPAHEVDQPRLDERPCSLVARLFLQPYDLANVRIAGNQMLYLLARERIKLFDANQRKSACLFVQRRCDRVHINLTAAEYQSRHLLRVVSCGLIVEQWLEGAVDKIAEA